MESVASIIAVLQLSEAVLSSCYRYAGKVKDAAADIDRVIHQIGYLSTILRDLKGLTEPDGTIQASTHSPLNALKSLTGDHGPLAVCAQCLEELKLKLPNGPISLRQKLQWPFESKKIDDVMDRITAQVPILELALLGDNYSVTVATKAYLENTKRREERDKVLGWLRCADPTVKHLASRRLHQPGSNHWVLKEEDFTKWRDNTGHTLWLHGIPGAGKTIICSTIIDHIEGLCKTKPEARLAYYYFDFSDQDVQKLDTLLRCLLWQLCKHDEYLPQAAWALYESYDNGRKQPSNEVLANTLFELLSHNPNRQSYVIIDALDECPIDTREHFFELILGRIEKHHQTDSYNFLFTSRKEADIEKRMAESTVAIHNIPIPAECVNKDVRLHVTQFIASHRVMKDFPKHLKTEIEDTISNKAQGMFQWAVCQLGLIKNCKQVGAVRKTLNNLPETLDDMYDRILASISDETWQIARTALMLLAYSIRPLTLEELAEGMVVDYEGQRFKSDEHRLTNYRHVLEICSSLVSVSKTRLDLRETPWLQEKNRIENRPSWLSEEFNKEHEIVQFAHFSVREYIILQRTKSAPRVSRFSFSPTAAHQAIAELCLVYLLDFSGGVRLLRIEFVAFPFLAYAAQHWPEHWRRQLTHKDQGTVNGLIQRILDTEEDHSAYINYTNICRPDALVDEAGSFNIYGFAGQQVKSLDSVPQPLYYTAQLGHLQLCQWLLDERGCDVNAVRGKFGQAIQIAARFGHKDVVELLLDRGAHVDRHCGEHGYPLQAAAYGGHVEVIKLLLDRGAEVNAVGGTHGSALIAACGQQHVDAARVLLDRGADMDIVCIHRGKALNIAAGTGNKALVRLLLRMGANINDTCGGAGTALYSAAESLNLEMVKMLVAAGADVNLQCRGAQRNNALQAACSNPHSEREPEDQESMTYVEIARFLLKHGADPNLHGGSCGDALQAAVSGSARGNIEGNNIDIVKLVLEHGAELNYRGGVFRSAMRACVYGGNISAAHLLIDLGAELDDEIFLDAIENQRETVVPRLLEKGVDVNAQNKSGTALQFAIQSQDTATIKILLSHPDIDVNALGKTDEGITALYTAVAYNNMDIVKQLVNLGADINQPSNGSLCLIRAVRNRNMEMINLLLDYGADINASLPHQGSALMAACNEGNEVLVQFLLDRSADINLWVPREGDALQAAAHTGNESIVKLLLARGANVKAREGRYGSCLESAIMAKNPALTHLLLDAGANVNYSGTLEELRGFEGGFGGPLSGSIWNRQEGLTRYLIELGANVNWPGREYYGTPLQEAIDRDDEEAVMLLLEHGAAVNLVGGRHDSALTCAIEGHKDKEGGDKYIQLLLDAGADVNICAGEERAYPLEAAVRKGNAKIVETILDRGADINGPFGHVVSPLRIAVVEGDLDIFRLLLSRGADPNITRPGHGGETPLAAALRCSRGTMLKELLEYGADPNFSASVAFVSAAESGYTEGMLMLIKHGADVHVQGGVPGKALHAAARNMNISMVKFLLDQGVDVNATGGRHGTALMAVLENLCYSGQNQAGPVIQTLLDAGANVNSTPSEKHTSALQAAITNLHHTFVDDLLARGADVNAYDPRFGTALAAAARRGEVEMMKKLVERGADHTLACEKFGTPLQGAARRHRLAALEYLFSLGADVNQLSGKTGYALHAACRHESENGRRVLRLLLDHGADSNARGGKYETALQAAANHGCLDNVKILLEAGADPTIEGGKYGSPLKAAMAKKKHYHVANFLRRYMATIET
ncbi:ankyrin repeat-containing domain protein [Leptodontidium sp. MPI-SDFR-AT-0119]|nr:ankyrin repeat-containing domain protein [Leptodontidium sp. MPI-SDFR-AT-0119]